MIVHDLDVIGISIAPGKADTPLIVDANTVLAATAAGQDYAQAQAAVGAMYQRGDGVPKDSVAAAGWYRKAAEQGVAEAQWLLGRMYAHGEGVPQDDVQAYAWMAISGMGRAEFGRRILDTLRERMTASQIEAAQKLSGEYAAKVPP